MRIRVIPNAKVFSIEASPEGIRVRIDAKAEGGGANRELLRKLGRVAGARAFLVRGARSREKVIAFDGLSDEEALEKMRESKL